MSTKFFREEVEAAVDALLMQQVLLYPTDTVWGLGCDAELPRAVEQVYKLKQRPAEKACIVLVADEQMFARYAEVVPPNLPELLATQMRPTTYVVPGSRHLAPNLLAPDGTIGLRVVLTDEFCQKVVRRLGHGLVSTSANLSGEPTPAIFSEVNPVLVRQADYVARWRQDDETRSLPSRVVRVLPDGSLEVLRD
ncbi:L-threonylcarbamoyladenylate synthase [Hymenobacter luteus]|uniref:L-threonylcarbamoyladenylate synthase n=2 Tax=Hymenobacter TaxID=89966 RepID=A0A7W9T4M6_9BACT|nr:MULTISPECIES: L-threonylcarbamoyladenylate synthase [Hymenobacter]MBB4603038.1 L-threonylcarbamoyladenylate synthase [Hymenobacter latericoloratus]MBB6061003.1 L-threonylcarbamoyladenylate synthase [Hymenobacter luteus]